MFLLIYLIPNAYATNTSTGINALASLTTGSNEILQMVMPLYIVIR